MGGEKGSGIFLFVTRRHERVPRHARLRLEVGRLAGHRRDDDEVVAFGALNLSPGMLLVALEMLVAVRAGEFEFVHKHGSGCLAVQSLRPLRLPILNARTTGILAHRNRVCHQIRPMHGCVDPLQNKSAVANDDRALMNQMKCQTRPTAFANRRVDRSTPSANGYRTWRSSPPRPRLHSSTRQRPRPATG